MKSVFGPNMPADWPYLTGRLYEKVATAAAVTPRTINALINSIALLWLQWKDMGVSFASVAYFAINREAIDTNVLGAVTIASAGIAELDPDWQRTIAALHYGVMPAEAAQILIENPLRRAIGEKDVGRFKTLSEMPSFDRVLIRILDQFAVTDGIEPANIFNVSFLLGAVALPDGIWVGHAWRTLRTAFGRTSQWHVFGQDEVNAIKPLFDHCNAEQLTTNLSVLNDKLSTTADGTVNSPAFVPPFVAVWEAAMTAAKSKGIELPAIVVPGPSDVFLKVAVACRGEPEMLKRLQTKIPDADLVLELATSLGDQAKGGAAEDELRALIALGRKMPWDVLVNAAVPIVRDQNQGFPSMGASLAVLGLLRASEKSAQVQLKALTDQDQFVNRLNEAYAAGNLPITARCFALLISARHNFTPPGGGNWGARAEQAAAPIVDALHEFGFTDIFQKLVTAATANAALMQPVRSIVSLLVRTGAIGSLPVEPVITNLPHYLACIADDLRDSFLAHVAQLPLFWDELQKQPFEGNAMALLRALMKQPKEVGTAAKDALKKRLDEVSIEGWEAAIREGKEPLPIASELAQLQSAPLDVGMHLYDAMDKMLPDLLSNADDAFRKRWYQASNYLTQSAKQTLFQNLRDRINGGQQIANLPHLLVIGGNGFISSAEFSDEPDDTVRHVILPLLTDQTGKDWLVANAAMVRTWVDQSKEGTRIFLTERLAELWRAAADTDKPVLLQLQTAWSLGDLAATVANDPVADGEVQEAAT